MCQLNSTIAIAAIDDDETILDAMKAALNSPQWDMRTYATGEEFLMDLRNHVPECIILDACLPGLSGVDVARRINAEALSIPIIVLTAYDSSPLTDELKKMDIAGVLLKPITADILIESIRAAINTTPLPDAKS